MALLAYMAAEPGMRDLFRVEPTPSDRKQQLSVRSAAWRTWVSRVLRRIADRIEPATMRPSGRPET
jgi:hypothetical protein